MLPQRKLFDINTSKPGADPALCRSRWLLSDEEHTAAMLAHIEHVSHQYNTNIYKQERQRWSATSMAALALHIEQTNRTDPAKAVALSSIAKTGVDELGMLPGWEAVTAEPKSYASAHKDPVASVHWRRTEEIEWEALWRMKTFIDVSHTRNKLHYLMWVYKVKRNKLKARLTIDGRHQRPEHLHGHTLAHGYAHVHANHCCNIS
jgi:hypothetical protein